MMSCCVIRKVPLEITPVVRLFRVLVEIDFGCFDSQINEGTGTKIREIGKRCFYRCLDLSGAVKQSLLLSFTDWRQK